MLREERVLSGERTPGKSHSIPKRTNAAGPSFDPGGPIPEIPAEVEYRGHRIVWDARRVEGTAFLDGKSGGCIASRYLGRQERL
jgi:hypothetical protein